MGGERIAPRILILGTRWRWVVSFMRRSLYQRGKSPRYSLDGRLLGPKSRSGRGGKEKSFLHGPCWESSPGCPACSL